MTLVLQNEFSELLIYPFELAPRRFWGSHFDNRATKAPYVNRKVISIWIHYYLIKQSIICNFQNLERNKWLMGENITERNSSKYLWSNPIRAALQRSYRIIRWYLFNNKLQWHGLSLTLHIRYYWVNTKNDTLTKKLHKWKDMVVNINLITTIRLRKP